MTGSVIAADGGGTRCRLILAGSNEHHVVETGAANMSSDFDQAIANLITGLEALCQKACLSFDDLTHIPAWLGLAGVISPEIAERTARTLPLTQIRVADDRISALRGALGAADGFLAHCGTGSFLGCQKHNRARLIGGWGADLGDEASAQWVARRALTAVLDRVDNLADATDLSNALLKTFDGAPGIVAFASHANAEAMGALAPQITRAAEAGDPLATQVMSDAARYLTRLLHKLGWQTGSPICLTGGIGPKFAPYLPRDMRITIVAPRGSPLDGALALSQDFAAEIAI